MKLLRSAIKKLLISRECIISRPPGQFSVSDYKYFKLKQRGISISSAVDGGAAAGGWTKMFRKVYPEAQVLCIEPRNDAFQQLNEWATLESNVKVAKCLLGASEGISQFNESDVQSSVLNLAGNKEFGTKSSSRITTLDQLILESGIRTPDLVKLDLQGYELQALLGAPVCLRECSFVELELSLFQFQDGQPLFSEAIAFMDKLGFRLYDILGLWHRPFDGALGQGDFLFVSKTSPIIGSSTWS